MIEFAIENDDTALLLGRENQSPKQQEIIYALAYSFYDHGSYSRAGELFARLVDQDPLEKKYLLGMAACFQMQADYRSAVQLYQDKVLRDSEDPRVHLHRAECLIALKEYDQAAKALSEAHKRITWNEDHQPLADRVLGLLKLVCEP